MVTVFPLATETGPTENAPVPAAIVVLLVMTVLLISNTLFESAYAPEGIETATLEAAVICPSELTVMLTIFPELP